MHVYITTVIVSAIWLFVFRKSWVPALKAKEESVAASLHAAVLRERDFLERDRDRLIAILKSRSEAAAAAVETPPQAPSEPSPAPTPEVAHEGTDNTSSSAV